MTAHSIPRFEPMTVGMLLDAAVRLYTHNLALMLGITACAYLPYLLLLLGVTFLTSFQGHTSRLGVAVGGVVMFLLCYLVAQPLSIGAITYAISERYLHRQSSVLGAMQAVCKRYKTLLWAQSVVGGIIRPGLSALYRAGGIVDALVRPSDPRGYALLPAVEQWRRPHSLLRSARSLEAPTTLIVFGPHQSLSPLWAQALDDWMAQGG